jgi:hypothetical protein
MNTIVTIVRKYFFYRKVDYFKAFGIWTNQKYIIDAGTAKFC